MQLGHHFGSASGAGKEDCHFLAYRYDARHGFRPEAGESIVGQIADGMFQALLLHRGWLTGLWRSTSGRVFISDAVGRVHMNPERAPRAAPWQVFSLPGVLTGVWGLDDDYVFAWGQRNHAGVVYLFDGAQWTEVAAPGLVVGMHGVARDLIYAVGHDGLIARWDGSRFVAVPSPTQTTLSSVFVASPDEMYAVGPGKRVLAGSLDGWAEVLTAPGMLHGVAKWGDTVWVGAGDAGLCALKNDELVPVKPNIHAEHLEARDPLLIAAPDMLVSTRDGEKFFASKIVTFAEIIRGERPAWLDRAR